MAKIKYGKKAKYIENSDIFDNLVQNYHLATDGKLVLLTKQNTEIIEALIQNDDEYFPFSQLLFDHFGFENIRNNTNRALFAVAREIDRDNSTNVWRYKKNRDGFYKLVEYISNPANAFFEALDRGDPSLPDKLVRKCGKGVKSLSSKICKYLSEFAFQKDNYYINDSFVRHTLLFYLDYYGVEHPGLNTSIAVDALDYQSLYGWLEKLHKARNEKYGDEIKKSELDHILWYCYKSFSL